MAVLLLFSPLPLAAQTPAERAAAAKTEAEAAPGGATVVRFSRLNRTWRDLQQELAPFRQGSMTVELSSPSWWMTVKSNRLALTPRGDGSHLATFEAELMGRGDLVAVLRSGEAATRMTDEVVLPLQRITVTAPVLLALSPQGLLVTPLELPERVKVTAESRLADQLVAACNGLALLALGSFDCAAVEDGLTRLAVPLPEAGETYLLPAEEITAEERGVLEGYLAGR